MNLNPTLLGVLIILMVSLSIYTWMRHEAAIRRWWEELWKKRRGRRQLKPKSPEVCPQCTVWSHILPGHGQRHPRAWHEVRSKSGRRKRIDTRGYACQNPECEYRRVTDPALLYGQLIKARSGYKLKFVSSIIRLGERAAFRARLLSRQRDLGARVPSPGWPRG
jgi:hypothetical protein